MTVALRDPRVDILMQHFGSESRRGEAEMLLQCLDEVDPFRDAFVHIWETEDAQLVVWGTHDINLIIPKAARYYREELGLGDDALSEMGFYERNLIKGGKRIWVDPQCYFEEVWEEHHTSKEPKRQNWVPVFLYDW